MLKVFEGDGAEFEDEYQGIHKEFRNLVGDISTMSPTFWVYSSDDQST